MCFFFRYWRGQLRILSKNNNDKKQHKEKEDRTQKVQVLDRGDGRQQSTCKVRQQAIRFMLLTMSMASASAERRAEIVRACCSPAGASGDGAEHVTCTAALGTPESNFGLLDLAPFLVDQEHSVTGQEFVCAICGVGGSGTGQLTCASSKLDFHQFCYDQESPVPQSGDPLRTGSLAAARVILAALAKRPRDGTVAMSYVNKRLRTSVSRRPALRKRGGTPHKNTFNRSRIDPAAIFGATAVQHTPPGADGYWRVLEIAHLDQIGQAQSLGYENSVQ
jgi:hypothetical protein